MNLNQVTVSSTNIEASIAFYEKLGLKLIVNTSDHYARFECPVGEATFSIHKNNSDFNDRSTVVYFEVERLEEKVKELQQVGIHFEQGPTHQPWLWKEAHLKDPDQNLLILYTAGENRKEPPWRLKNRKDAFYK